MGIEGFYNAAAMKQKPMRDGQEPKVILSSMPQIQWEHSHYHEPPTLGTL